LVKRLYWYTSVGKQGRNAWIVQCDGSVMVVVIVV
jgi:hypothetical protein